MRRDIKSAQLLLKLHRVADIRQQIGQRNELAVLQYPSDKAGVRIAPLLTVGQHIDPSAQLGIDGLADRIVRCGLKLVLGHATGHPIMNGTQHPTRPRPGPHTHDGKRPQRRCLNGGKIDHWRVW